MTVDPARTAPRAGQLTQDRLLVASLLSAAAVCWWLTLSSGMAMDAQLSAFLLAWPR